MRIPRGGVHEKGQSLTEYALIVVLVAIVALAAVKLFGKQIKSLFESSTSTIATETQNK